MGKGMGKGAGLRLRRHVGLIGIALLASLAPVGHGTAAAAARPVTFALLLLVTGLLSLAPRPAAAATARPDAIDPAAKYLFFYHNYYVETKGPDGDCKYYDILKTFADRGFVVISEIRGKDVSVVDYAKKAAADVQKVLDARVPQENVTLAGHSKGGVIVIRVAALLQKPRVNYVVMAGCGIKALEKGYPDPGQLKGNFLSLYATSDKIAGSCGTDLGQAKQGFFSKEIPLESAAGHQLFFKPADLWVDPLFAWLKEKR